MNQTKSIENNHLICTAQEKIGQAMQLLDQVHRNFDGENPDESHNVHKMVLQLFEISNQIEKVYLNQ
jgi:hypothetical protein